MTKILNHKYFKYILIVSFSLPFILLLGIFRSDYLGALLFFVGLWLGHATFVVDEKWLYKYYSSGEITTHNSTQNPPKKLVTKSVLFLLILIPLSLFVITSSGSMLGAGLILGLQLTIVEEIYRMIQQSFYVQRYYHNQGNHQVSAPAYFQQFFFYDFKNPLSQSLIDKIFYFSILVVVITSIIVFT